MNKPSLKGVKRLLSAVGGHLRAWCPVYLTVAVFVIPAAIVFGVSYSMKQEKSTPALVLPEASCEPYRVVRCVFADAAQMQEFFCLWYEAGYDPLYVEREPGKRRLVYTVIFGRGVEK